MQRCGMFRSCNYLVEFQEGKNNSGLREASSNLILAIVSRLCILYFKSRGAMNMALKLVPF